MRKIIKYLLIFSIVAGLVGGVLISFNSDTRVEEEVDVAAIFLNENLDKDYRELLDNFLLIDDDEIKRAIAFGRGHFEGDNVLEGKEVHGEGMVLDIPTVYVKGGDREAQYSFFEIYIGDKPWNGENIKKFLKRYPEESKYVVGIMLDGENKELSVGDTVKYKGILITIPFEETYGQSYLDHSEIHKIDLDMS